MYVDVRWMDGGKWYRTGQSVQWLRMTKKRICSPFRLIGAKPGNEKVSINLELLLTDICN